MVSIKASVKTRPKEKLQTGKTKKPKKNMQKEISTKIIPQCPANKLAEPFPKKVKVKKNSKYILPTKYVTESLVASALTALENLTSHYTKKNAIFGDETPIFVEIRCIKIQHSKGNIKFVLPHSTIASTGEICLITKDLKKGKKKDHEPTLEHWEEMLRKANVTAVKTVLPMRQLRVEYDQYELKRRLLTQHDFIMVDTRVLNHVSHELGKIFFKKHNMLIPVKLNEAGDIKHDIDVGLRTVMLRVSEGQTSTVLIGHTAMPQNEIKENILALVQKLKDRYPGGEENIRSLSVKLPLSLSLPLYITLRPSSTIGIPKIKHTKSKHFAVYEGELTTKLNSTVRVAPDGTVHVKKINNKKDVEMSDMEEDEMMDSDNENKTDNDEQDI